jgi:hypothetical protein
MPKIPTRTIDFPHGNVWGITNGDAVVDLSFARLLHAAITVGHDRGWRRIVGSEVGGQMELLWKMSAVHTAVHEKLVSGTLTTKTPRLVPTDRFRNMDPSERRALNYHLGMSMSAAWVRKQLRVPWLLHLDVYRDQLGPNLAPGNSRPDLVGRHPDGRWVVIESKGGSFRPTQKAQTKAKQQAQRIIDIGGVTPSLSLATFSFFAADRRARRPKPKVATMWVVDPPSGRGGPESIILDKLTEHEFFRLYYQPWLFLFENSSRLDYQGPFVWRHLSDLDLKIGILTDVKKAFDLEEYAAAPKLVQQAEERLQLASKYPDWAGDGIVIILGSQWLKAATW